MKDEINRKYNSYTCRQLILPSLQLDVETSLSPLLYTNSKPFTFNSIM